MSLPEKNNKIQRDASPTINIIGEQIALGPLRPDLIPLYHSWDNDFSTSRTRDFVGPSTIEEAQAEYDAKVASERQQRMACFTIYERTAMQPIGMAVLDNIDYLNRTATFGITIGKSEHRGRGYGTETSQLMLDYAFTALGLYNVLLTVLSFNLAGQRAYQKAGFREIGRRRQSRFMGGKWWDTVYMDCLATEFVSPVLGQVLVSDADHSSKSSQSERRR